MQLDLNEPVTGETNSKKYPAYCTLNNGIQMPFLGLGVYDMHQKEAERAVLDAFEIGYLLIDTASMYGNELEIGHAINRSNIQRTEIFLTTKLNNTDHGFDETLRAFDKSLKLLGQEYIDLYLIHWPLKGKRKESWLALEKLYREKRVRAIGVANYDIALLEELKEYATMLPAVNQIEFSPWLFQEAILNYCDAMDIQLQAYSPLTRGLKFNDPRLLLLCNKYNKTPAQMVLRWHLAHGISPIPKSTKKERLLENFEANFFSIEASDLLLMDSFNENFRICDDPHMYL